MPHPSRDIAISPPVAARLIEHLRNDTTDLADRDLLVPIAHFTDPARARAEIALMKSLPQLAAHAAELPAPGDFITRDILGTPLLIVRRSDGEPQAYLNMCRHRGGRVATEDCGHRRVFMCRYHGWSYERDSGALRAIPYESSFDPIDRECNGLIAMRTEQRHGLIFVVLSKPAGGDLADYFGAEVDAQLAPWRLQDSVVHLDRSFTLEMNWKLVMDGAIDILHPQFLHADGVGKLIETNVGVYQRYGRHGQHFGARTKLRTLARAGGEVEGSTRYIGSNLVIYPNTMVIFAPDHVELWQVTPHEDPNRCTTRIRFLVRADILSPEITQRLAMSWEVLEKAATQEDWPMERWIQQNAQANPGGRFRYGRSEVSCQHLHRQLAQDLDGEAF